jgi:hypothetical protein
VAPPLALALIIVPSYNWSRAGRVPGKYYKKCQAAVFETKAPPADLLLIGASRTGFGVDNDLIDLTIDPTGGFTTEKIVLLGNAESDSSMALRTYLRERGAPRSLGIEMMITRTGGESMPGRYGAALTNRSYALFGADAYKGYLDGLIDNGVVGLGDVYVRSHFVSPINFFFKHLQVGFDNAYRTPGEAINPMRDCSRPVLPVWYPVASAPYTDTTPWPNEAKLKMLRDDSSRYIKINVDSRRAAGEIAAMRDMAKVAKDAGVETVFFYYFPSFGEGSDVIDLDRLGQKLPEAEIFDARPVLNDPNKPGLNLQYRDRAHLTKYAAYEVSRAFATFLQRTLKP